VHAYLVFYKCIKSRALTMTKYTYDDLYFVFSMASIFTRTASAAVFNQWCIILYIFLIHFIIIIMTLYNRLWLNKFIYPYNKLYKICGHTLRSESTSCDFSYAEQLIVDDKLCNLIVTLDSGHLRLRYYSYNIIYINF